MPFGDVEGVGLRGLPIEKSCSSRRARVLRYFGDELAINLIFPSQIIILLILPNHYRYHIPLPGTSALLLLLITCHQLC